MRRKTSWIFPRGLAALLLLALPACVESTTTSGTATSPNEATGTTAPVATTPAAPATPISPHPTTTAVTPVATAPATPTTTPTVAPTATAPTSVPGTTPAAGGLAGTWESGSCGARAYARRITFTEPASFTAEDLVSPCPKGTQCIWSGIINRSGSYKTQKDIVTLTVSKTGSGPAKTQFPPSLTLDSNRVLVEAGSDGKPCAYTHAGGDKKP